MCDDTSVSSGMRETAYLPCAAKVIVGSTK